MENSINDNMDFNEMKEQIKLLREKLNKETIVNEALVRNILHNKVQKLERQRRTTLIMGLLWLPVSIVMCRMLLEISWAFCIVTLVYGIIAAIFTFWTHRGVNSYAASNGNLLTMAENVTRMRTLGSRWLYGSIPFLICWLTWFYFEISSVINQSEAEGVLIGGIIGALIGVSIGTYKYREFRRTTKEILNQINELKEH